MRTPRSLSLLLASASLVLLPLANAGAQDVGLFSGSGGAKPNIMILLDPSGSMNHAPAGCTLPDGSKCPNKRIMASQAIDELVRSVNPPDGAGGYVSNARFGLGIYDRTNARVLVPIGDDSTAEILQWNTGDDPSTPAVETLSYLQNIGENKPTQ